MLREREQNPALWTQEEVRSELQDLLGQAIETPLNASVLSQMVVLSEFVKSSLEPETNATNPWARTPTETSPHDFNAVQEIESARGLDEETACSDLLESESAEKRVTALLSEFQVYLKYQLYNRAHHAVLEACAIAREATGDDAEHDEDEIDIAFPDLEKAMQGSEKQLSIILRLLCLAEQIEDTQIVTLHTPDNPPWSAFVVHKGRICFGCILEGRPELDGDLKKEAPAIYKKLSSVKGNNLRQMQEIVGDAISPDVRTALTKQMARAFLRLSEFPPNKPYRIKQTKVADPGKVCTFAPFELYREACAALFDATPMAQSALDQFQSETSFGAEFRILPKHTPVLVRATERLQLHDLEVLAKAVDQFAKAGNRLAPGVRVGFVVPMNGVFWCAQFDDGTVALTRFEMKHLGRISNWINQPTS